MADEEKMTVSQALFAMRRMFAEFEHEPRILQPSDARAINRCLKEIGMMAQSLENEVTRLRWNVPGRGNAKRQETAVLIEATRPGTNVLLLSRFSRPFSDGRPRPGGAA